MFRIKVESRESAPVIAVLLFLLLLPALFRPFIHGADSVGYYSWVRSAVIEGTLDVTNTFHHYAGEFGENRRETDISRKTPNGYAHNQWAAGSAILWAPAFLTAHAGVLAARAFGSSLPADGYSWPYPLAASLATAIYGLIAVLLIYAMARRLTGRFSGGLAAIVLWLASPLVFYMYSHPLLSHANDAFITALFVYVWWRTQNGFSLKSGLLRGAIAGLATWVRPQNGVLILILGMETFADLVLAVRRKQDFRPALFRALSTLAGYLAFFLPLMLFWHAVFGTPLANTYAAAQPSGILDWSAPNVLKVLFSSNRGLFIWAPVTLPALIGLRWLFRLNARLTWILGCMFLAQLYIVSSWFGWSGNVSFGPRFWVSQTVVFSLGLAALIGAIPRKRALWMSAGSILVVWNFLLIMQYALGTVPRHGLVDLRMMVRNQFTIIPANLPRILQTLMNRGR